MYAGDRRIRRVANTAGMLMPVRCKCGEVYDAGHVTVTARYADCSVWSAPCCGRQADDRREWGGRENNFNYGTRL